MTDMNQVQPQTGIADQAQNYNDQYYGFFQNKSIIKSAPGMTRTCGTQIRNLVLYPPELRGH